VVTAVSSNTNSISLTGTLRFSQANDGTFTGQISGSGTLVKNGAGNLTLAGVNSYAGGTFLNAGGLAGDYTTLQGNIAGSNGTVLTFNQSTPPERSVGTFPADCN
jgi:autotransporter-associated beta strand protein